MRQLRPLIVVLAGVSFALCLFEACTTNARPAVVHDALDADSAPASVAARTPDDLGTSAHQQQVMKSSYCASCHPDVYAEHAQNTHGRAFTDEEVRLGTGRFSQADCIICHTPRPIFESGIGMNPIRRHYDLEEGNTCMTCHWKEGQNYASFLGGKECKTAFDPRVGSVEACASCHRNHGTPYQWAQAPTGKAAGTVCIDCHMPEVERPPAVGEAPRLVHSHVFPASRSESQLRRAYRYDAQINGNEVVVTIANKGAGHNFPTELKQRAVESLVVVRDLEGQEVARSRMVFRDPYKRPYGLVLEVNTQIPAGEQREHRVPLNIANGTVSCELHYKLYYPIEDYHPDLARRLESRELPFTGIEPSTRAVESDPEIKVVTPEGIAPETASPADLVDYVRPKIAKVEVDIPTGSSDADIQRLIELFQFPVGGANAEARKRLAAIGMPAVPALVTALGSWDNKTWNQSMGVLEAIGAPAVPALVQAMRSNELYVRLHATEMLSRLAARGAGDAVLVSLRANMKSANALDRAQSAATLGDLKFKEALPELRRAMDDADPDVVRAAARSLARLEDHESIPLVRSAMQRFIYPETRRDLADVLARMGDASGIPVLIEGLDQPDDLVRESFFETLFNVTGLHFCYEPLGPHDERLEAIGRWQSFWAKQGGPDKLRHPLHLSFKTRNDVKKLVEAFGGGDGATAPGDDVEIRGRLVDYGREAIPGLTLIGLKYPAGFSVKRAQICSVLSEIKHPDAVPALVSTLRDPVIAVAAWACHALGVIGDQAALPAVQRYHNRLLSLVAQGKLPDSAGSAPALIAQAASARFQLEDARAEPDLVGFLISPDVEARRTAFNALRTRYGEQLEYDPQATLEECRAAVATWQHKR